MSSIRDLFADTRPFANADYRRLFTANIGAVIGAQLTAFAIPAQLYALTQDSGYVGLAGVFGLVPLVVFGLWGGALVDHFDRRRVLEVTSIGFVASSLLLAVQAAFIQNVWALLVIYAAQQGFFAVNNTARTAAMARILPSDLLPAANALGMTLFTAGAVSGPLLAGMLLPATGFTWLYVLDALITLPVLWSVIKLPPMPVEGATGKGVPGFAAVFDGFRYLALHPILLMSFVVDLIAMIFGLPRALFPEIAHERFGGALDGGIQLAVVATAMPIGSLIGGVFSGWVSRVRSHGAAILWSIVAWGVGVIIFGAVAYVAPHGSWSFLWLASVGMVIGGAADMVSSAFRTTLLQTSATDAMRGRLQGVFIVVVAGGPRVADVLHGYAARFAPAELVTAVGGVIVLVGVAIVAVASPAFRTYQAEEPATD